MAVVARRKDNTVTVFNLKSGIPQLSIDAGTGVCGLGVIGNTIVVIGDWKAITWELPTEACVPGAWVDLEGSARTINLSESSHGTPTSELVSRDPEDGLETWASFRHIAFSDVGSLYLYSTSTGELLWMESLIFKWVPRFSPDGCNIWITNKDGEAEVRRFDDGKVQESLGHGVGIENPPEGYPWGSSLGYRVTDDWWVLGPDGKRLLTLPPSWQSSASRRVWEGQFLALLHGRLSEPVILELEVNSDL